MSVPNSKIPSKQGTYDALMGVVCIVIVRERSSPAVYCVLWRQMSTVTSGENKRDSDRSRAGHVQICYRCRNKFAASTEQQSEVARAIERGIPSVI